MVNWNEWEDRHRVMVFQELKAALKIIGESEQYANQNKRRP